MKNSYTHATHTTQHYRMAGHRALPLTIRTSRSSMVRQTKEEIMGKKLLAGVLGGIAFFLWSFIAHDVLPLGTTGIKNVPNENAMLGAMKASIPDPGLYFFPALDIPPNATRAQQSAAMEARMQKIAGGPSGFLVYHPSWNFSFGKALATELGTNILLVRFSRQLHAGLYLHHCHGICGCRPGGCGHREARCGGNGQSGRSVEFF